MDTNHPAAPDKDDVGDILAALERELISLDRIGLHIAAAHLDASIQQLRMERARQLATRW